MKNQLLKIVAVVAFLLPSTIFAGSSGGIVVGEFFQLDAIDTALIEEALFLSNGNKLLAPPLSLYSEQYLHIVNDQKLFPALINEQNGTSELSLMIPGQTDPIQLFDAKYIEFPQIISAFDDFGAVHHIMTLQQAENLFANP